MGKIVSRSLSKAFECAASKPNAGTFSGKLFDYRFFPVIEVNVSRRLANEQLNTFNNTFLLGSVDFCVNFVIVLPSAENCVRLRGWLDCANDYGPALIVDVIATANGKKLLLSKFEGHRIAYIWACTKAFERIVQKKIKIASVYRFVDANSDVPFCAHTRLIQQNCRTNQCGALGAVLASSTFCVFDLFSVRSKSSLTWSTYFFIDFSMLMRQMPSEISSSSSCRLSKPERSPATTFLHMKNPVRTILRPCFVAFPSLRNDGSDGACR